MFKKYQADVPLGAEGTSPKGHYVQKGLLDYKYRPEEPLRSERTDPKSHYFSKGSA
jgi:hypothetical protein